MVNFDFSSPYSLMFPFYTLSTPFFSSGSFGGIKDKELIYLKELS